MAASRSAWPGPSGTERIVAAPAPALVAPWPVPACGCSTHQSHRAAAAASRSGSAHRPPRSAAVLGPRESGRGQHGTWKASRSPCSSTENEWPVTIVGMPRAMARARSDPFPRSGAARREQDRPGSRQRRRPSRADAHLDVGAGPTAAIRAACSAGKRLACMVSITRRGPLQSGEGQPEGLDRRRGDSAVRIPFRSRRRREGERRAGPDRRDPRGTVRSQPMGSSMRVTRAVGGSAPGVGGEQGRDPDLVDHAGRRAHQLRRPLRRSQSHTPIMYRPSKAPAPLSMTKLAMSSGRRTSSVVSKGWSPCAAVRPVHRARPAVGVVRGRRDRDHRGGERRGHGAGPPHPRRRCSRRGHDVEPAAAGRRGDR